MFYNTYKFTPEQRINLLEEAKSKAIHWWVDVLTPESMIRQTVDLPWEEVLPYARTTHISFIHRNLYPENYLEIGFRATKNSDSDIFLWIKLSPEYIPHFLVRYPICTKNL